MTTQNAINNLLSLRNAPLIIMYRENFKNCFVYVGGSIQVHPNRVPSWDGKGVRIDGLFALLTGADYTDRTGISLKQFYSGDASPKSKGTNLIKRINGICAPYNNSLPLFDRLAHVTARGHLLDGVTAPKPKAPEIPKAQAPVMPKAQAPVMPKAQAPVIPKGQAPEQPKGQAGYDFRRENVIKAGWRLSIDQIKFYSETYKDDSEVIKALDEAIKHKLKSTESQIKGLKQSVDAGANGTIKAYLASEISERDTLLALREQVRQQFVLEI